MNLQSILGIAATASLFLPAAVILYNKLFEHKSLAALLTSYLMTGLYNLMSNKMIIAPDSFVHKFGIINNYLDIPLMLLSLLFFCPIKKKQKPVHFILALFLIYELIIGIRIGLHTDAIVYIMGPGLTIVLVYSFYLFAKQVKFAIEHSKNIGRTLMLASILFSYGCYAIVYFFYYVQKTPDASDAFLLYFISTSVGSVIMAIGLHLVRKRLRELQEVKNTRKELSVFFNT